MCVCSYIHTRASICAGARGYVYTYVQICVYPYTCAYTCICVYTHPPHIYTWVYMRHTSHVWYLMLILCMCRCAQVCMYLLCAAHAYPYIFMRVYIFFLMPLHIVPPHVYVPRKCISRMCPYPHTYAYTCMSTCSCM